MSETGGTARGSPAIGGSAALSSATAVAAVALAIVVLLLGTGLWDDRQERLGRLRADAETRAVLLAQSVDGVLRQVDVILSVVAFELEEHGRSEANDPLQRFLARQLPTGGCLIAIEPTGVVRSSSCPRVGSIPVDPEVVADHASGRVTTSMSHNPALGLVALRRSAIDRRGRFLGVIQATFDPTALLGYSRSVGDETVEALATREAEILVGPASLFAEKSDALAHQALKLIASSDELVNGIKLVEGNGLVAVAAQTRTLPLLAVAATPTAPTLHEWWRIVMTAVLATAIAAGGAWLLLVRLYRIERSRAAAIAELRLKDQALAQSINGIVICRADGDNPIVSVNRAFEQHTGYVASEVLGTNPRFMHGTDTDQPALDEIRAALRAIRPTRTTLRNYRKDGSLFYNEVSIAPVCDDEGRLTHFLGIHNDITARIQAEQALEDRLRFEHTLLDTIPLPVFFKDMDGIYLGANAAFEQALGLERGGARGKTVYDIADAEIAAGYEAADRELRKHGGSQRYESKVRFADGSLREVIISKAVFLNAASRHAGIVGVFNDIHEIKQREAELANLVDQRDRERTRAEAANRAKSNFLACMSHELRTPLNAILGFSEIIHERSFGDDLTRYAEYAGDIHESGEHLLSLINDILDLSKIEAGKLDLVPAVLEIEAVVGSVIRLVRQRASDHGHALTVDFGSAAGERLLADERAVKQILFNLLSNAIKFTPDRGRIAVSCRYEGGYIRVSVSDTGIGIPAELLETVMQPFQRVDDTYTRQQEGTGLGLSLVDALVKAHGGTVSIESAVNAGTTVSVTLPGIGLVDNIAA